MHVANRELIRALTWVLVAIAIALLAAPAAQGADAGRLDPHFGAQGRVNVGKMADEGGQLGAGMAIAPNGSIFVATQGLRPVDQAPAAEEVPGSLIPPLDYSVELRRYFPDGRPDSGFGIGGVANVATEPGLGFELKKLCVDSRGRPVLLGTSFGPGKAYPGLYSLGNVYTSWATVIRLTPDGTMDSGFAGDGIALFDFGLSFNGPDLVQPAAGLSGGAVDAHDRVVLMVNRTTAGIHGGTRRESALVARIDPDGTLDPEFGGGDGIYPLSVSNSVQGELATGRSGAVTFFGPFQPNSTTGETELIRLTDAGSPDESLGSHGSHVVPMYTGQIAIDPWGRTYLLGSWFGGQKKVARLKARGGLDHNFGRAGFISLYFQRLKPTAIVPDHSGGLFVVGSQDGQIAVIHRTPSGRLDRRFGNGGRVLTRLGADLDATGVEADLDRHGRLLVGGLVGRVADLPLKSRFLLRYLTR